MLFAYDCYIGDLELSIFQSEAGDIKDIMGVMPYIAPELFNGGAYSQASDIYAFGMIKLWRIISNCWTKALEYA